MTERSASHAGSWYSSNANELKGQLEKWLQSVTSSALEYPLSNLKAIIGPFVSSVSFFTLFNFDDFPLKGMLVMLTPVLLLLGRIGLSVLMTCEYIFCFAIASRLIPWLEATESLCLVLLITLIWTDVLSRNAESMLHH